MLVLAIALAVRLPPRTPESKATYFALLASMGRLALNSRVLRQRVIYQCCLYAAFSVFWTTIPMRLMGGSRAVARVWVDFRVSRTPSAGRDRRDRRTRIQRSARRVHGCGGAGPEGAQPRGQHALLLLSTAGARPSSRLVQVQSLSLSGCRLHGSVAPAFHCVDGDTILTETLDAVGVDKDGVARASPPNPTNGPIFVHGAEPRDALCVEILRMTPTRDTGWTNAVLAANVVDPEIARILPGKERPRG